MGRVGGTQTGSTSPPVGKTLVSRIWSVTRFPELIKNTKKELFLPPSWTESCVLRRTASFGHFLRSAEVDALEGVWGRQKARSEPGGGGSRPGGGRAVSDAPLPVRALGQRTCELAFGISAKVSCIWSRWPHEVRRLWHCMTLAVFLTPPGAQTSPGERENTQIPFLRPQKFSAGVSGRRAHAGPSSKPTGRCRRGWSKAAR